MRRNAAISEDGIYRYSLERDWSARKQRCIFVMLNPSTADAEKDDPTIRRCIGFAKQWKCGGLTVLNLFAFRCTNPKELFKSDDSVGPENDAYVEAAFQVLTDPLVVFAWGSNAKRAEWRVQQVELLAKRNGIRTFALGVTKNGQPIHPLYQPKITTLRRWRRYA